MSENRKKYLNLCHAMQSGVAMKMNHDPSDTTPKSLRVGINTAMCDHAALVMLLIEKGVISMDEYEAKLVESMEREVKLYETNLSRFLGGAKVTLL